ncbi:unnamed protein product [Adineta steineri]|uniref:Uncharacterized protein n=1 Tax=Adineta steineri TaxID=433720 RepID=A0A815RB97_9BILA|nr:unnamed protein product [Adineta steineri]
MDYRQTSSLSFQQQNHREEESTTFNHLQTLSKNMISTADNFNTYDIPFKSSGKSNVIIAIQENRKREKHDLNYLNDRFTSYVARVHFLEGQNKALQLEIDQLRQQWSSQKKKIREMYEVEINSARYIINDTNNDRAAAELRAQRSEEDLLKLKEKYTSLLVGKGSDRYKIERLQKQISSNEADINLFHRRLVDLQDEHKRYQTKSQDLIIDIKKITKEIDHEVITRMQLENQKEQLEKEIKLLQQLHKQKVQQIKQISSISTQYDETRFFKNDLSKAIKKVQEEYEERNYQQRNELEAWYQRKVAQTVQEIQFHHNVERSDNIRKHDEFNYLQTLISDSQHEIATIRQRNENMKNSIQELEKRIYTERDENIRASTNHDHQIKELRARLEVLDEDYSKLNSTKSTLNTEIADYRKLLEGEDKSEGLKDIINNVRGQNLSDFLSTKSGINQGCDNNYSMLSSCIPIQSVPLTTLKEPTIFEQVYGGYRRPTTTTSFNTQRISAADRSCTYKWSGSNIYTRKSKIKTFFESRTMRKQQQPKATTPPSSDYTDAYLTAFSPKPIPTKHIYRLSTSTFTNVAPLPFISKNINLSTDNVIKTSETRFNNIETSNSFERTMPHFPNSTATPSPNFSTKFQSFFNTPPNSFETQTSNPNSPILSRNSQSSNKTNHTSSRLHSVTNPAMYRSTSPDENAYKPISPTTITTSSLPLSTKSSILFQCAPSMPLKDMNTSNINEHNILSSLDNEKRIERPETLLFQHDEDIHSFSLKNLTPIITPSPIESKIEPEHPLEDELTIAASKPIEILENTITKYDSLINQISDILATVSPLSSTVSSMSPNKSVLDYELSADGSPILHHKRIESPTSTRNAYTQRMKTKHMIREDSYDKIVVAIKDLDSEITPPSDIQTSSLTKRIKEETKLLSDDELEKNSSLDENKKEIETLLRDIQQLSTIIENEKDEHQYTRSQTELLSNVLNDEATIQKINATYDEVTSDNKDDTESSSNQNLIEELYPLNISKESSSIVNQQPDIAIFNKTISNDENIITLSSTPDDQHIIKDDVARLSTTSTNYANEKLTSEIVNNKQRYQKETSIEPQISSINTTNLHVAASDFKDSQTNFSEKQIKSISSLDTIASALDSTDRQTPLLNSNVSQTSQDKQTLNSRDTFLTDEQTKEIKSNEVETITQPGDNTECEARLLTNESISAPPNIESPIDTLANSISSRYISSDVYHGYLGERTQYIKSLSKSAAKRANKALRTYLHQTISTPIIPLIETIPNFPSSMQMMMNKQFVPIFKKSQSTLGNLDIDKQDTLSALTIEALAVAENMKELTTSLLNNSNDLSNEKLDDNLTEETEVTSTIQDKVLNKTTISTRASSANKEKEYTILDSDTIIIEETDHHENYINPASTTLETIHLESVPSKIIETTPIHQMLTDDTTTTSNISASTIENNQQMSTTNAAISSEQILQNEFENIESDTANLAENDQSLISRKSEFYYDETEIEPTILTPPDSINIDIVQLTSHPTFEKTDASLISTDSDISEIPPIIEINKVTLDINQDHNISQDTIQDLMNDLARSISSRLKHITDLTSNTGLTKSINTQSNDSIQKIENEDILRNPSNERRPLSPTNTEPNSSELIHALRGHSIALHNSTEQQVNPSEQSTTSTTSSSHITSSDRYVSYAIHEMHDSLQDRLPIIPLAADLPLYKRIENVPLQSTTKEEDSTEFDATENLTSYSDDILYRRLYRSNIDIRKDLDSSSTDDDVDEEFEEHDLTNIHRINHKLTETSSSLSANDECYRRYDVTTTLSSNDSLSSPLKQQADDVYLIPGYPGLWRTSIDNDDANLPIDYDADDEGRTATKTKTIVQVSDSLRRPLSFQPNRNSTTNDPQSEILTTGVPLRPNLKETTNRPTNNFSFEKSESDSYHTCPSSIYKQRQQSELNEKLNRTQQQTQSSPEESIFLICERERGVSLPVTMNIDYDDIAFRLSTSTPNEAQLCSTRQTNLLARLSSKTESSCRASSPSLNSYDNDQQKRSSWLNNLNTFTTTTDDTNERTKSRITFQKSAKGPISISECHSQGHYIIVENTSRSKNIDLSNWIIHQENENGNKLIFTFPDNCLLESKHSLKILANTYESEQKNDDELIATSISTWHTGSYIITTLINPEGKDRATLTKKTIFS